MAITVTLISSNALFGALQALVINQSVVFFITLVVVCKSKWFNINDFLGGIDKTMLARLSHYSVMAVVSILAGHVSLLVIRNYIGENLSWEAAGYWQAVFQISDIYLMFITASLGVYYLPKLSELKTTAKIKQEVLKSYQLVIPLSVFLAFVIYIAKPYIVSIAFTSEFAPMIELFKWQLIGDVIKMASWVLSYLMIAKAMTRLFILTEICFSLLFVLFSIFFVNAYGLIGITYAYALNVFLYLILMMLIFAKRLNKQGAWI